MSTTQHPSMAPDGSTGTPSQARPKPVFVDQLRYGYQVRAFKGRDKRQYLLSLGAPIFERALRFFTCLDLLVGRLGSAHRVVAQPAR